MGVSAPVGLDMELGEAPARPEATWRVPAQIAELVQHSPHETVILRLFAWFFVLCGIGYYFIYARRWETAQVALTSHIQVLGMTAVAQLCLVFLYARLSNKIDLGPGLRRLQTKVPAEDACPVAIDVIQHEVVTGSDEGFAWIEDGTLYFKGLQTVFRLNVSDVPPLSEWPRKYRPSIDKGIPPRHILIPVDDRMVRLRLQLIDPFEDRGARRRSAMFNRSLVKWLAERPTGSLESLLPPLGLHLALQGNRPFRYEGLIGGICLLAINLFILATARLNWATNDLMSLANAIELAAGILLSWMSLRLIVAQWRNIKVRKELTDGFSTEFSKNDPLR